MIAAIVIGSILAYLAIGGVAAGVASHVHREVPEGDRDFPVIFSGLLWPLAIVIWAIFAIHARTACVLAARAERKRLPAARTVDR